MAALQRSTERLGARRQRHILSGLGPLLSPKQLGRDRIPTPIVVVLFGIAGFIVAMLLTMAAETLIAALRSVKSVFTASEVASVGGVGGLGALAWGTWRGVSEHRALSQAPAQPKQLAASLRRELAVSQERRAEVERLSLSARRAFWLKSAGDAPRLLLECEDQWVVFCPPRVSAEGESSAASVHQRWIVERLRWTHALLSVTGHGPQLDVEDIAVPPGELEDLDDCEVLRRGELPHSVQGALPTRQSVYRG